MADETKKKEPLIELEKLENKVDKLLLEQNKDELKKSCMSLNIYNEEWANKTKRQLIREIQDYLETFDDDIEMKTEVLTNIMKSMDKTDEDEVDLTREHSTEEGKETERLKVNVQEEIMIVRQKDMQKEMELLQKQQQELLERIKSKEEDYKKLVEEKKGSGKKEEAGNDLFRGLGGDNNSAAVANLLRKEFRIKGCVGDPNQKDKLSLVSLKHQINNAKQSGYSEQEIVSGVIRAMHSSLRLKSILEMKKDLTLPTLLKYLQHHFEEKSSTDLCAQLTNATQTPNETPVEYVLRCIELREKLMLSSKSMGEIEYDRDLVFKLFLRTLERGFENVTILQEIKPVLRGSSVTDEEILAIVQKAAIDERERQRNFIKKGHKVNQIGYSENQGDIPSTIMSDFANALTSFGTQLKELTEQVKQLQANQPSAKQLSDLTREVNELKKRDKIEGKEENKTQRNMRDSRERYLCEKCKDANVQYCNHCYKCGGAGHLGKFCRKSVALGEASLSLGRDTQ